MGPHAMRREPRGWFGPVKQARASIRHLQFLLGVGPEGGPPQAGVRARNQGRDAAGPYKADLPLATLQVFRPSIAAGAGFVPCRAAFVLICLYPDTK
jgi:hypothetical protein